MKKLFVVLALILTVNTFAFTGLNSESSYKINRSSKLFRDLSLGTYMGAGGNIRAIYDSNYTGMATSGADIHLVDDEGAPVKLKANAIIINCFVDVVRGLTSTHLGSLNVSLGSNAAADLVTQAFVGSVNFARAGRFACTPVEQTVSTYVKMTSEGFINFRVNSEAIAGGRFNVQIEYVTSD